MTADSITGLSEDPDRVRVSAAMARTRTRTSALAPAMASVCPDHLGDATAAAGALSREVMTTVAASSAGGKATALGRRPESRFKRWRSARRSAAL
jgi:hypothetical protein